MADAQKTLQVVLDAQNKTDAAFAAAGKNVDVLSTKIDLHSKAIHGVELAGAAAIAAVVLFSRNAIQQYEAAARAEAQLEAVIKSTGGVAGVTAAQVEELSNRMGELTTYENDAVVAASSLLLTFTNIHSNVFPETVQATLDMATAMGTDLQSAAVQLGKALNDPTQGLTALTRSGVTFSAEQKKVIEALAKTGQMEEAQKLILAELSKEFGGSAAAAAATYGGQITILHNKFKQFEQLVGMGMIPVIANLGSAFADTTTDMMGNANVAVTVYNTFRAIAEFAVSATVQVVKFGAAISALGAYGDKYKLTSLFWSKEQKAANEQQIIDIGNVAISADQMLQNFVDKNEQTAALFSHVGDSMLFTTGAAKTMGSAGAGAYNDVGASAKAAGAKVDELKKKIEDTTKSLLDEQVAASKDALDVRLSLAKEYAAQEEKIADLKRRVAEEQKAAGEAERGRTEKSISIVEKFAVLQAKLAEQKPETPESQKTALAGEIAAVQKEYDALGKEAGAVKTSDLQSQLAKEEAALGKFGSVRIAYAGEIADAERMAGMTDFERKMAEIQEAGAAKLAEHQAKIDALTAEMAASQAQKDGLAKVQEDITAKTVAETGKREEAVVKSIERVTSKSVKSLEELRLLTGHAEGPSAPSPAISAGPGSLGGGFSGGGFGGGGGGTVFNFYGDVNDKDALIKSVMEATDRKTQLGAVSGGGSW